MTGYLERQLADAGSLIEALGLTRPTVVGHSWGGIIALGLAARRPELVSRLALMEPPTTQRGFQRRHSWRRS